MSNTIQARPDDMRQWLPYHHIEYACDLLAKGQDGRDPGLNVMFAKAHIAMAQAKMTARQRA